ncbi:MAG TPA: hypothetical protein PKA76_19200 [Pirellulaceae bacterium]|nr:hypothetical protein [Pirellulaceae bacterium]
MDGVIYTDLPKCLHRQTMYDWGRRGIRSHNGFRFRGARGRLRCYLDPAWLRAMERIPARSGHYRLLRRISSMTPEWIAVSRRRGQFWVIEYYLVPREAARKARQELEHEEAKLSTVPF